MTIVALRTRIRGSTTRRSPITTQAISLLPKTFPIAYFNRGLAYHNQELDDQAIVDYTTRRYRSNLRGQTHSNWPMPTTIAGMHMNKKVSTTRPSPIYTMAISLNPGFLEGAYANRVCNDYSHKARYDLAIADFSKVISARFTRCRQLL